MVTPKKVDRMVERLYKVIKAGLDLACPLVEVKDLCRANAWFDEDLRKLRSKVRRQYGKAARSKKETERSKFRSMNKAYRKKCALAKKKSWRKFVETTPNENKMSILNKIVQNKDKNSIFTLNTADGTTEPGLETIRELARKHFPAATEGIPHQSYDTSKKVTFADLDDKYGDWISTETTRSALRAFKPNKAPGPDGIRPFIFKYFPVNVVEYQHL